VRARLTGLGGAGLGDQILTIWEATLAPPAFPADTTVSVMISKSGLIVTCPFNSALPLMAQ
jgi:hypothetical protein